MKIEEDLKQAAYVIETMGVVLEKVCIILEEHGFKTQYKDLLKSSKDVVKHLRSEEILANESLLLNKLRYEIARLLNESVPNNKVQRAMLQSPTNTVLIRDLIEAEHMVSINNALKEIDQ